MRGTPTDLRGPWTTRSLLRFAVPTILNMVFMGLYTSVDTIFVSRFVGQDALASINIVCPVINLMVGLGSMVATGGNALVSRTAGSGDEDKARSIFTALTMFTFGIGVLVTFIVIASRSSIIELLGASPRLHPYCRDYLTTIVLFAPACMLQIWVQYLLVTAGNPRLGLTVGIASGCANALFDYLCIVQWDMGIGGAALATGIGYALPVIIGLPYFAKNRRISLYFSKPSITLRQLGHVCFNGSSEMIGQMAMAVTTYLFNRTMMQWFGEGGVAAITIIIYVQYVLSTMFIGLSMGVAPVIGHAYGRKDGTTLKKVIDSGLASTFVGSVLLFVLAETGGFAIVALFAESESEVNALAVGGFGIFAFSLLFSGANIFVSALFTAMSNGKVSAFLSLMRTFGLTATCLLVLPRLIGPLGIWIAIPVAETITAALSAFFLIRYRLIGPHRAP